MGLKQTPDFTDHYMTVCALRSSHCLHFPLLIGFWRIIKSREICIKPQEFKVSSISIIVSTFLLVCLSTHSNLRITKPTQLQIPYTGHIRLSLSWYTSGSQAWCVRNSPSSSPALGNNVLCLMLNQILHLPS